MPLKNLEGHPEIAVRAEVCNSDAFELAAEDHISSSFGLHCQHFVEARGSHGDVNPKNADPVQIQNTDAASEKAQGGVSIDLVTASVRPLKS